jgi:hypothetical protein
MILILDQYFLNDLIYLKKNRSNHFILLYFSRFGSSAAVSQMIMRLVIMIVFTLYFSSSLLNKALGNLKVQSRLFVRFEILTLKKGTFGLINDL